MTTKKATHIGTCQVCFRKLKLPNGVIAKHGYTVIDSTFVHTCEGSDCLPFEQDCTVTATQVDAYSAMTAQEQARYDAVRNETDAVWIAVKRDAYSFKDKVKGRCTIEQDGQGVWRTVHTNPVLNNRNIRSIGVVLPTMTTSDVIQSLNTKYVETYIRPIVELYSTMQNEMRRRLETWVVKELIPIEKG